jgi:hypothetical protein
VSSRSCPDWPELMEIAPDLQFRHLTLAEVQLPGEAVVRIAGVSRDAVSICCDPDSHVFNADHTEPEIVAALAATHWIELRDWAANPPRFR